MSEKDLAKETHPGFTVVCDACKSKKVVIDSNVGWSDQSGAWGGVDLQCLDCGAATTIWEPY